MTLKKGISHEILGSRSFTHRAKSSVLSIILFALLIFFMLLNSAAFKGKQDSDEVLLQKRIIKVATGYQNSVNSLLSSSGDGEEGKYRRKLPEFEMFMSDELTEKFHGRVLEFFNQNCEVQFFMTWISAAESFGKREILALESVFKSHPDGCLVILSRTLDSVNGYRILKPFLDRKLKVQAITPDLPFLVKNTPAESWFEDMKDGNKDPGGIPLAQNLSNLMRLVVLYKYGGIYLDTDFIVLKSFKSLKNTIGAQSIDVVSKNWTRLNNAVLIFDMNHPLLFKFIEEFALTFDGNKWGHNGPYMVSRVVYRIEGRPGYNFTILPPMAFYPVDWHKIGSLFKKPTAGAAAQLKWVEAKLRQLKQETYGVHLWNKQSSKLIVEEGSVMGRLISENCVLCEQ
ncbi:hypothetical protein CCACVL1_10418 [Corchorus capsularis]|uniref:Alpha 1,4-glycosyltransferase domain-containing protein n=1 Tax=Corchorus capsularis TaxID=210143 RepID=A0A1R3IRA7_COCAP|nr:hypothetical protein CCACVL1_10418 [Corchorus capsularis]